MTFAIPFVEWPYPTEDEESHLLCFNAELLQARIDMLLEERAEVKAAKRAQEGLYNIPREWKLTPQESRLLLAVLTNSNRGKTHARREVLLTAVAPPGQDVEYARSPTGNDIVSVLMCKLRAKLKAALGTGPHIEAVWGQGYIPTTLLLNATLKTD